MRSVHIIGGGLAGLSLGVYLRKQNVPVKITEAGRYPMHKVCGEFICGVSNHVLQDLGVADVITQSIEHRSMTWWMQDSVVMKDKLPTVAWGLSRYKIDEDLARLFVNLGGHLSEGSKFTDEDSEGIVWAIGKRKKRGRWIGLKIHVLDAEVEGLEMHVGHRGYIGLCGVEGGRTNCCGLFRVDKSAKGSGSELIEKYLEHNGLFQLGKRFHGWGKDKVSFTATAGFSFGTQEQAGQLCVGDASYLIPPFTGNGMSMALESAWLASPWILQFAQEEISWSQAVDGYHNECVAFFQKRMRLSTAMQPLLFHRFGRTMLKTAALSGVLPFEFLFRQLRTP